MAIWTELKSYLSTVHGLLRADGLRAMSRISRKRIDEVGTVNKAAQIQLGLKYRELLYEKRPLPDLEDVEFRAYSQNGEDGLLLFLFTLIGTTNKRCVEICAGNGVECNTANLIINHGWDGLLFDGNGANVRAGRKFYATCPDTFALPPKFVKAWITTESVNQLIREHGFAGEVDLLSLDLDGNDYWIWEALDCVDPRAVILEYQNAWGPEQCVTQRYNPRFVWNGELEAHVGASLPAFVKLARRKGYRLVGCQRYEFNAIFLRNGLGEELFPEIPVEACFRRPLPRPKTATGVELVQV